MSNKFTSALKTETQELPPLRQETTPPRKASRQNLKHIGGYFDRAVSKQLNRLALEEDSTAQALLEEALDMLFQSRGQPMIATRKDNHHD